MDPKLLIILITALANVMLAAYVLSKNPKKIINVSFMLFTCSAAIWSLALFVIGIARDYELLKFAGHMAFWAGALTSCNFLLFAYVFPQMKEGFPPLKVWLRIYVPGLIVAIAAFTPFVMKDIINVGNQVRPVYGKGIIIFLLYTFAYTGYGLLLLAKKYMRNPGRFERVQLKYTFGGLLVSVGAAVVITLILPLAGISRYSTPLTPLVIIVASGSISYAIVRHRLMDLGVVFRNVLIFAGIAIIMVAVLIVSMLVLNPVLGLSRLSGVFLAAIFAAILVHPTKRFVEYFIDKYFFRGRYDYPATLTEFSSSMTRILNLEDLQNRIVNEVASILQVKSAALLLMDPDEERYTVRSSIPPALRQSAEGIAPGNIVIEKINRKRLLLVRDELRRMLPRFEFEPLEEEFERLDAEVFIPLVYRGELIGLLSLGEKGSADIYSREDLNLLATLGNQAAVALENALLYHKVTMLMNHNENILKHMSSGLIATDRRQIIDTCNDKARHILRLPLQGVLNRRMDVLPPPLREMLANTLEGKATYSNHEVQILSGGDSIAYLNAATSLIKDENDEVTGALLVFTDLTEIKLLESEMWRADKLASLGTLAAGMAHEIKNPLVSIKTFAQLLPTRYEDKDFRDTFSSITIEEVERINNIVEKLLEFARPTAPLFESVDMIEIIEEVLLLLTAEFTKHSVTVLRDFEMSSAPIIGDKAQLKQAMLNLCLNGMQAIQETGNGIGGELKITVGFRKRRHQGGGSLSADEISQIFYGTEVAASAEDAETLVMKIHDSGRGIGRKALAKIFDPFFTTKEKGLGLGLAVVHGIVKEHSGNISVDSQENAGTEFIVSLPVTQLFAKEKV
ncbi:MAG: GAF domain-containing protein [Candidatus Abyssubacteria bacterium]|nr:GAF domain-containing protein [Candidatus Abyssubacteria bacterium]